jgi:hypothetical protein
MGHAARAKQRARAEGRSTTCGNPEPFRPSGRVISQEKYNAAVNAGTSLVAAFSDRKYALDKHGSLRRLPPDTPAPRPRIRSAGTVTITRSEEPAI